MKKFASKLIYGKDAKLTLTIIFAAIAFIVVGCSGGGEKSGKNKPLPSSYYGGWTAKDGASLQLTADGTGHYKSGGTTVTGAAAELDETGKILKLSFFGVSVKEFKIDQEPKNGKMTLDGMLYINNFKENDEVSGNDNAGSADLPSNSEVNGMVEEIILAVNDAVQKEDFDDLRTKYGSRQFIEQISNDKLKVEFSDFIKKKSAFNDVLTSIEGKTPTYSPAPSITEQGGYKLLNLNGSYDTKPPTTFVLQYVNEDGEWKLLKIRVRVSK